SGRRAPARDSSRAPSTAPDPGPRDRSSTSTVRRSPPIWWSRSCSASREGHSRTLARPRPASSRPRTVASSFWTRSGYCPKACRPSCSRRWRSGRCVASGGRRPRRAVPARGSTRPEVVDAGIVAATSEDLLAAIRARRFREDLYHRLAVVTLRLPPLRERGEDILTLGEHFLRRACEDYRLAAKTLDADARAALQAYAWPGNVRELANVMERVALLSEGSTVTAAALGLPSSSFPTAGGGGVRAAGRGGGV